MNVLDLFSGIGGFAIGLERAGMRTVAFCEIEPFCRAVLRKHWPTTPCFEDVRTLDATRLAGLPRIDVVCGGFPCQDISLAGDGAGLAGERSGLWRELHRIIELTHPAYAIIENVSALRSRGLEQVLGQLAAIGYDAEWHCIPAAAIGALHRRDRIWIVAYPERELVRIESGRCCGTCGPGAPLAAIDGSAGFVADAARDVRAEQTPSGSERERTGERGTESRARPVADANEPRLERWLRAELRQCAGQFAAGASDSSVADTDFDLGNEWGPGDCAESEVRRHADRGGESRDIPHTDGAGQYELAQCDGRALRGEQRTCGHDADGCGGTAGGRAQSLVGGNLDGLPLWLDGNAAVQCPWGPGWEDGIPRVASNVVNRVLRLRALGNSIVPQLAEIIGRAIMKAEQEKATALMVQR